MPLPLSISGSIRLRRDGKGVETTEHIGARIEASLKQEAASSVARQGTFVRFKVAFFRLVSKWNILVPLDSGTLEIEDTGPEIIITYCVSTKRTFVVVCGVILALAIISVGQNSGKNVAPVSFLSFAWAAMFGGSYFVTAYRFPRWLKRNLERDG